MKRSIICLLVILTTALSTASFAAKKSQNIKAEQQEQTTDAGRFGFGLTNTTYGIAGLLQADKIIPSVRYNFTDSFSGILGLSISSSSIAGSSTEFGVLLRGNFGLFSSGPNTFLMGFSLNYISNVQSIANSSSFNIGLTTGIETKLNTSVVIGAYIVPLSVTSSNIPGTNGTNFNIFDNAILASHWYI